LGTASSRCYSDRPYPQGPSSARELRGIQNYLAGLFVLKNAISHALIGQLHFVDSQGLDRTFASSYVRKVMAVTPQDIQRMSESHLVPSKMTIGVVGDKAKIAEQLKLFANGQ
jgi:predicted Zn-dependent peptidase